MKTAFQRLSIGDRGLKSIFLALALGRLGTTLSATVVLTNSDPTALSIAIEQGGTVTLAFDGSVALTHTLAVATNTTVDATGREVILSGGQRHFRVNPGATLRLVHLTLANGRFGGSGIPGDPDAGGAIHSAGGSVELLDCQFTNNSGPLAVNSRTQASLAMPQTVSQVAHSFFTMG